MTPYELGATIHRLRKERKLTQANVAEMAGISRPTLSKMERGLLANVSVRTLFIILDALDHEFEIIPQKAFGLPVLGN